VYFFGILRRAELATRRSRVIAVKNLIDLLCS
jgi:hypothetical protein